MNRFDKPMLAVLKDNIEHQGIGGKTIIIERYGTIAYMLDRPFTDMTIGEYNFVTRRIDLMESGHENDKLYYGHVGNLGYFVSEDEIVGDLREVEWETINEYM